MNTSKLKNLFDLLAKVPAEGRPNLAILTDTEFLFCYKDKLSHSHFVAAHGPVTGLRPERGAVIEFFTQLELITNQILLANLAGTDSDVQKLEEVLDHVDLFSKVRLLYGWGLIDKHIRERLHRLRAARNSFAHNWDIEEIRYVGKPIKEVFEEFQADATTTFDALIRLYNGGDVDVEEFTKSLSASKTFLPPK